MNYKNNIFILKNIHKSNDEELLIIHLKKYYLKFIIIIKNIEILMKLLII